MAAGKGYDHVSAGLEYLRGGRSEIDRDPEGKSSGYDMTGLQTVPVWWNCLATRENCFQQTDKFAGHVDEGLNLRHRVCL